MYRGWLEHIGRTDLIAAAIDITLGVAAAAWFVALTVRALHNRGDEGPSK